MIEHAAAWAPGDIPSAVEFEALWREVANILDNQGVAFDEGDDGQLSDLLGALICGTAAAAVTATNKTNAVVASKYANTNSATICVVTASDGSGGAGVYSDGDCTHVDACEAEDGVSTVSASGARAKVAASRATNGGAIAASGYEAAIIGCLADTTDLEVSGDQCAAMACKSRAAGSDCEVAGECNAAIASSEPNIDGECNAVLATINSGIADTFARSAAIGCNACSIEADGSVLLASDALTLTQSGCVAGGMAPAIGLGWRLESDSGDVYCDGSFIDTGADYAEYFETSSGAIKPGTLVAMRRGKMEPADAGDEVLGVVSAHPGIVGDAAGLGWAGRVARDAWGKPIIETTLEAMWTEREPRIRKRIVVDPVDGSVRAADEAYQAKHIVRCLLSDLPTDFKRPPDFRVVEVRRRVAVADFDPGQTYLPRSARPNEWACVGLVGKLRARVDKDVAAAWLESDDEVYISAGTCGIGTVSQAPTKMQVMALLADYDSAKGYAIAMCYLGR